MDDAGKLRVVDGPHNIFRCFSASQEAFYPVVYEARKRNTKIIELAAKDILGAAEVISNAIPKKAQGIRIHVAGDFKTRNYFEAWLIIARENPSIRFYAYTKSLPFWVQFRKDIPKNFMLTASRGGHKDKLIREKRLRQAVVIHDPKTVSAIIDSGNYNRVPTGRYKGWDIDHDDSHAAFEGKSFALLIHNTQPSGSDAGKSLSKLRKAGSKNSYSR